MRMLSADAIAELVDSLSGPRAQARTALIREIREAHAAAVEAGDVDEGTAIAATFTLQELTERGVRDADTKGAGIKAGRNGKGEIALVRTVDEDTVLVVLRNEEDVEPEGEDNEEASE